MKTPLDQKGISHLVAILTVVVIAVIGVIGYQVMQANDDSTGDTETSQASDDTSEIKNSADVEQAGKELDSTSLDEVDPSQLDAEINSVL